MNATMSVQVDSDTLLRLISQLKQRGGAQDVSAAISSAMELWLRAQAGLAKGSDPAALRGYQWKSLFLPDGTELRSWSYGEHNYARVVGDQIIHQGQAVSPSQFAQKFARSFRNAWIDISVRRPEDRCFIVADRLRQELATKKAPAPAETAPALALLLTALQAQLPQPQLQQPQLLQPQPPPPHLPAAQAPQSAPGSTSGEVSVRRWRSPSPSGRQSGLGR